MPPWSRATRFAFHFSFVFFAGILLPWPAGWLEDQTWMASIRSHSSDLIVSWLGRAFHLGPVVLTNGSDRLYDWLWLACRIVFAIVVAVIWSVADRKRTRYDRLHDALRVYIRYFLASAMFSYGFAKLGLTQFPSLSIGALETSFGDASPMGLLWRFMGDAPAYQIFGGIAEVTGGMLLLFRRTTTLGALVLCGVLANVVALNFSYDVNVKLYSSALLLMTCFLVVPDAHRLLGVFVLNHPTDANRIASPLLVNPKWTVAARVAKALFVTGILWANLHEELQARRRLEVAATEAPLAGRWAIEPPATWERLTIFNYRTTTLALARLSNDSERTFTVSVDTDRHVLTLVDRDDRTRIVFQYAQSDATHLNLSGELDHSTIQWPLRKLPPRAYPLVERGFHWVNDGPPFNR